MTAQLDHHHVLDDVRAVLGTLDRAVVGRRAALTTILLAVLADGHILIEDLPGLGKTMLARSLATVLGLETARIQFTPDLLPADVVGATSYNVVTREFEYRPGPVFTNVLIADEINRTSPKTQAALLEGMAERQVSVDGRTRPLPTPFVVLATENPIEHEGTYPLPEAQLDRFAVRLRLGYLSADGETELLRRRVDRRRREPELPRVLDPARVVAAQRAVEDVAVHDDVLRYVVVLAEATRRHPQVEVGASPRAELDLLQLSRARALLAGRDFALPDDVKALAVPAFAHRLVLRPEMWARRVPTDAVVEEILARVPAPRTSRGDGS
ncbi:AAA family ATPase [Nocardia sp. NPDC003482]|uniref:AAA family ATPase n=1 Tax=Nocardia sp. NPDC004068 TaxID=3364303 RepID=UPI0036B84315